MMRPTLVLFDIDRWFIGEYVYLLDRLAGYDEGGTSVLDNSAVVFMNELSNGKIHDFRDLPYIIAGSCGGCRDGDSVKRSTRSSICARAIWSSTWPTELGAIAVCD